jgi:hypothetical protein
MSWKLLYVEEGEVLSKDPIPSWEQNWKFMLRISEKNETL